MRHYWISVLTVLSAVSLTNLATPPTPVPLWSDIRVKHTWDSVPANWECLGPPPADIVINLYIALKPDRENALIDALYEVSDPGHQKHVVLTTHPLVHVFTCSFRYGAHLSNEQIAELVAPHQDSLELVHSWLEPHRVPSSSISTSHGGGWLSITGVPVSQANELLFASYQLYRPTETNETNTILRTVSYSLPVALHAHVQTVAPTTYFGSPRTLLPTALQRSSEEAAVMMNATSGGLVRMLSRRDNNVRPSFLR